MVDAALPVVRLDDGVNTIRTIRHAREPDPAHVVLGQTADDCRPGNAAILAAVNAASRSAVDQGPNVPAPLIAGRKDTIAVARIDDELVDTGVLIDRQNQTPALAAVARLIQAAVTAGAPERSLRGNQHRVRILWVDPDLTDVARVRQSLVAPRHAAVARLIHAVAEADTALRVVFPGSNPDDPGVRRIELHDAQRIRTLLVKKRSPGRTVVFRLEQTA